MKNITVIVGKIYDFIKHHTLVFVLMCLGILASNLMFIYFGGNVKQYYINNNSVIYNIFSVQDDFIDPTIFEQEKYAKWITDIDYYVLLTEDMITEKNNDYFELSDYFNQNEYGMIRVRKDFTNMATSKGKVADLSNSIAITIPESLEMIQNKFSSIEINGTDVQVVGATITDMFWMSYDSMLQTGLRPSGITVQLDYQTNASQQQFFCQTLQNNYGLIVQREEIFHDISDLKSTIILLFVVYITSMFALIYIMIYLTESYSYELNIYKLCGATHDNIIFILGMVSDIILLVMGGLSVVSHQMLYQILFRKINLFDVVIYNWVDYIAILITTFMLNHITITWYLRCKIKKSIIANTRRLQH